MLLVSKDKDDRVVPHRYTYNTLANDKQQQQQRKKFFLDPHLPFQMHIYPVQCNTMSELAKLVHLYSTMQGY